MPIIALLNSYPSDSTLLLQPFGYRRKAALHILLSNQSIVSIQQKKSFQKDE